MKGMKLIKLEASVKKTIELLEKAKMSMDKVAPWMKGLESVSGVNKFINEALAELKYREENLEAEVVEVPIIKRIIFKFKKPVKLNFFE
jgi:hypothetical protein